MVSVYIWFPTDRLGFVGHIIGLGDRHGSNILVDQLTWSALHIDFGDVSGKFVDSL